MLKKIILLAASLTVLALPVQATNTYWTAARVSSCNSAMGVLPIGISICDVLYSQEDGLLGTTGSDLIGFDAAGAYDATTVSGALDELAASTAGNGASIVGLPTTCTFDGTTVQGGLAELCLTTAGNGANLIGYQDGGSLTLKATVDDALDQVYGNVNRVFIGAHQFRECDADGDVANIAGNGGILASDTTPIMLGLGTTDLQTISYAATVVDAVCASVILPPNVDGTAAVTVNIITAKDNAGNDVPTWTVLSNWIAVGAAPTTDVTDTSAATADDALVQSLATTIAAADVPDAPIGVSLNLVPGAHGTDALYLFGVEIVFLSE